MSGAKVVLITGATAGIGRHAALHLAKKGYRVFATGRRKEALAELKAQAEGLALETFELDVTNPESIEAARNEIERRTNGYGVDVVVNNAGYGLVGPLEMITDADLRAQFDTNFFGMMNVTRAFLPQMRKRGSGRIVNVSSMGGRIVFPFMGAYHATKYAMEAVSDAMRMELAPAGIQVVILEPGSIRSEFSGLAMGYVSKYETADSPYKTSLTKANRMQGAFEKSAVGPESTSRAIERIIEARRPRARVVAPLRTYAALLAFKTLPSWLMDLILRTAMGLRKK